MRQVKIEQLIAELAQDKPSLNPRIKSEVMAYVEANGFTRRTSPFWRYAVGLASVIFLSAGGTVLASQLAQPGEALYYVKRASESAYVTIQTSPAARAHANEALIARRVAEARFTDQGVRNRDMDVETELAIDARLANDLARESEDWVNAQELAFSHSIESVR